MKLLSCITITVFGVCLLPAGAALYLDTAPTQVAIEARFVEVKPELERELGLDWAQFNAAAAASTDNEHAWGAYWRNRAGAIASQLVAAQVGGSKELAEGGTIASKGEVRVVETDVNAQFRAAATPEANLSRVPAPKLSADSSYVPKPREGEPIGINVDYARIEAMIHRYPAEPTSTVPLLPPIYGPTWGGPAWGGAPWGGYGGVVTPYWPGYCQPPLIQRSCTPSPCVLAAPVVYNPYCGGGVSGGFYYGSRHFAFGIGF